MNFSQSGRLLRTHTHTHTHTHADTHTDTHTHVKPTTTRSSREVNWYCCCGVDCEETDRIFFLPRCKLHAYGVFLCVHCLTTWAGQRGPFFLLLFFLYNGVRMGLYACFCCCLFMLFFGTFFVNNVCSSWGSKFRLHMSPDSASPFVPFTPWSVPIP